MSCVCSTNIQSRSIISHNVYVGSWTSKSFQQGSTKKIKTDCGPGGRSSQRLSTRACLHAKDADLQATSSTGAHDECKCVENMLKMETCSSEDVFFFFIDNIEISLSVRNCPNPPPALTLCLTLL